MKILGVAIKNFLIIGQANIDINDRGLVLIQGDNQDDSSATSNGAGKSSVADAICWCLYGETARDCSGDDVINDKAKKDCHVALSIEDSGVEYVITRYRKDRVCKNDLVVIQDPNGKNIQLTKGTVALTQEVVNQIIGSTKDVFVASAYFGQEMMPDLPRMTDKQLKLIVEEAAGTELLQSAYEAASADHSKAKSTLGDIRNRIALSENDRSYQQSTMTSLEDSKAIFLATKSDALSKANAIKGELTDAISKLPKSLPQLKIDEIKNKIAELNDRMESAVGDERATLAELDVNIKALEERKFKWELEVKSQTAVTVKAKDARNKVGQRVGMKCGECGKEYHEHDIEEASTHATVKLRSELASLQSHKKELVSADNALQEAQVERKIFADSITDISTLIRSQNDLRTILDQSNDRQKDIDKQQAELSVLEYQIATIYQDLQDDRYDKGIEKTRETIDKINADIDELVKLAELQEKVLAKTAAAMDVFGRAGARAHILDSVTPFLNEKTAEYLGTLTDGNITAYWSTISTTASGEIREKFSISVEKRNGSRSFKGLSGGEKRKVRLATAMALQDLIASRATKPIEFQFLDEIDHAIDPAGLERLMTILTQRSRARGTIFVISHNDLKSYISDSITVVNNGGISTIIDK